MKKPRYWTFVLYVDKFREHRWSLRAANGAVVADSAEGYKSRARARSMVKKMQDNVPSAIISVQKPP